MEAKFMEIALEEAKKGQKKGEVPIGACIVQNGKVIAKAFNMREKHKQATAHAEILAIQKACKKKHGWRLDDCDIYVTLKPCPMCAGAISNARIKNVYFSATETNASDNLCEKIFESTRLNHKVNMLQCKEYEEACSKILTEFFQSKRK